MSVPRAKRATKEPWHDKVKYRCAKTEADIESVREQCARADVPDEIRQTMTDALTRLCNENADTREFAVREAFASHSTLIPTLTDQQIACIEANNPMLPRG